MNKTISFDMNLPKDISSLARLLYHFQCEGVNYEIEKDGTLIVVTLK